MYGLCNIAIPKMYILTEDFFYINGTFRQFAKDRNKLPQYRNICELEFMGYNDDPRGIPEIPEVVNWIKKSIEEGIPWFYFIKIKKPCITLPLLMASWCIVGNDPVSHGRYILNLDRAPAFLEKNLDNLKKFAMEYDVPDDVVKAITDDVQAFMKDVMIQNCMDRSASADIEDPAESISETFIKTKIVDKNSRFTEAIYRLSLLESKYNLSPNIKKYFAEGRIYYSYMTDSGIGTIDAIEHDERYANVVKSFDSYMDFLVYHVIESDGKIYLLYVSMITADWPSERPMASGIKAAEVDPDTFKSTFGYIKLSSILGVLYKRSPTLYPSLPSESVRTRSLTMVDREIVERLRILKAAGIETDLDIEKAYINEMEICCSTLQVVSGVPIAIVDYLSSNPWLEQIFRALESQIPQIPYFLMTSAEEEQAILFLSEDPEDWDTERASLQTGYSDALVFNPAENTAYFMEMSYRMLNGGPIALVGSRPTI